MTPHIVTTERLRELIRIHADENLVPGPQDEADTLIALREYQQLLKGKGP